MFLADQLIWEAGNLFATQFCNRPADPKEQVEIHFLILLHCIKNNFKCLK